MAHTTYKNILKSNSKSWAPAQWVIHCDDSADVQELLHMPYFRFGSFDDSWFCARKKARSDISRRRLGWEFKSCLRPKKCSLAWAVFHATSSDFPPFVKTIRKKKVNSSRYRPCVAKRVGRGIALLFHDRGTRKGWVVSSTPRPHFTRWKDSVPIVQEAGWSPRPVWTSGKSRPKQDSFPDRPARSQSLYRLSYPAHLLKLHSLEIQVTKFRYICEL